MLTQNTSRAELLLQSWINFSKLLSGQVFSHNTTAALLVENIVLIGLALGFPLAAQWQNVVAFVPLSEWGGIDDNDSVLHQSLGADQFVVGCVVNDIDDTGLAGGAFG